MVHANARWRRGQLHTTTRGGRERSALVNGGCCAAQGAATENPGTTSGPAGCSARTCASILRCAAGWSRGEAGQSLPRSTLALTRAQRPQRMARRMEDDIALHLYRLRAGASADGHLGRGKGWARCRKEGSCRGLGTSRLGSLPATHLGERAGRAHRQAFGGGGQRQAAQWKTKLMPSQAIRGGCRRPSGRRRSPHRHCRRHRVRASLVGWCNCSRSGINPGACPLLPIPVASLRWNTILRLPSV